MLGTFVGHKLFKPDRPDVPEQRAGNPLRLLAPFELLLDRFRVFGDLV